jgi:hypothetical protein
MNELRAEIDIAAPADVVWSILTDLSAYESWNPYIVEAVGVCEVGERLTMRIRTGPDRETTLRPRLLAVEPPSELRWIGRLGVRGIFDSEHSVEIRPHDERRVRVIQRERVTGVGVPLLGKLLTGETRRGLEQMNLALQQRAEERARRGKSSGTGS